MRPLSVAAGPFIIDGLYFLEYINSDSCLMVHHSSSGTNYTYLYISHQILYHLLLIRVNRAVSSGAFYSSLTDHRLEFIFTALLIIKAGTTLHPTTTQTLSFQQRTGMTHCSVLAWWHIVGGSK